MGLIDFILNLAGLLLWVNWRALPYDALATATPATLAGTLRRAEPSPVRRWHFLAALLALLLIRPLIYCALGPALNWTAQINFVATSVAFRSDFQFFDRMLLFSLLGFGVTLALFYSWLLLVSILGGSEQLPPIRLAKAHLGGIYRWPLGMKLLLPLLIAGTVWWLLTWPLSAWGFTPVPVTPWARLGQAALVGLGSYLTWKYLILALLGLYLVHNHFYFGPHALWTYVDYAAKQLLRPLGFVPLKIARADLTPVLGILLVWFFAYAAEHGLRPLDKLDRNGRVIQSEYEIPGLVDLYRRVSR